MHPRQLRLLALRDGLHDPDRRAAHRDVGREQASGLSGGALAPHDLVSAEVAAWWRYGTVPALGSGVAVVEGVLIETVTQDWHAGGRRIGRFGSGDVRTLSVLSGSLVLHASERVGGP